jgi:hypothetical protein
MRDVYPPTHWAIRGEPPAFDTPDDDVYIAGRNVVLLAKAAVFMARAKLGRVFIGSLAGNPFPDATAEFFDAMGRALALVLAGPMAIEAPYATLHKADVMDGAIDWRAARADLVVHAADSRPPLRALQQVPSEGRISGGGRRRSDWVCEGAAQIGCYLRRSKANRAVARSDSDLLAA